MKHLGEQAVLGYCTNVHPGMSWEDVMSHLRTHVLEVQAMLPASVRFAPGIWISSQAASELITSPGALRELRDFCAERGLRLASINGFPFGDFHGERVKRQVYLPDWSERARLDYTLDLCRLAREMGTPGREFSVSTLPLGYRESHLSPEARLESAARQLATAAWECERASRETGVRLHVDLEPEPHCLLETSTDVVRFFVRHLLPRGAEELAALADLNRSRAEELLLEKIRVCWDVCHSAVAFESAWDVLANYTRAGIQVGKVQLSAALRLSLEKGLLPGGADPLSVFSPWAEDRYLHQTIGTISGKRVAFQDLPDAMRFWREERPTGEFRVHYHVPIDQCEFRGIPTTQAQILELFEASRRSKVSEIWEVETYTSAQRGSSGIAREIEWAVMQ